MSTKTVGDKLVDAKEPRNCQETCKRIERKPLQEVDHGNGEENRDSRGKRKSDDHHRQEDATKMVY